MVLALTGRSREAEKAGVLADMGLSVFGGSGGRGTTGRIGSESLSIVDATCISMIAL